jgi:ADP-heptose:LPS heptosyltransferase
MRPWSDLVFRGSGLVDNFIGFSGYNAHSRLQKFLAIIDLVTKLHGVSWDIGIALDLTHKINWEPLMLRLVGAKVIVQPPKVCGILRLQNGSLSNHEHVADQLLEIVKPLAVNVPKHDYRVMNINVKSEEVAAADVFLKRTGAFRGPKPWIAVGPWSNMQVKQWPIERFIEVILRIRDKTLGTTFFFGGEENARSGAEIVERMGFGYAVAGFLNVRQSIALMKRCDLFIGNDSGAMHMAVSAGLRCVAIFSGRDYPGLWEPYGKGHIVLRKRLACEGCMLRECKAYENRCIKAITVDEVFDASQAILKP